MRRGQEGQHVCGRRAVVHVEMAPKQRHELGTRKARTRCGRRRNQPHQMMQIQTASEGETRASHHPGHWVIAAVLGGPRSSTSIRGHPMDGRCRPSVGWGPFGRRLDPRSRQPARNVGRYARTGNVGDAPTVPTVPSRAATADHTSPSFSLNGPLKFRKTVQCGCWVPDDHATRSMSNVCNSPSARQPNGTHPGGAVGACAHTAGTPTARDTTSMDGASAWSSGSVASHASWIESCRRPDVCACTPPFRVQVVWVGDRNGVLYLAAGVTPLQGAALRPRTQSHWIARTDPPAPRIGSGDASRGWMHGSPASVRRWDTT